MTSAPLADSAKLGVSMRFQVVVDGINLGGWASCAGLSVDFKNVLVGEGANYEYRTILPDRVEYHPVVLKRAMTREGFDNVQSWLSTVVKDWYKATSPTDYGARTARITLYDSSAGEVASWALRNVYPARWSGPDLNATGNQVAIETLELVHEGFL